MDFSIVNKLVDKFMNELVGCGLEVTEEDISVYVFPQIWGDTSLGYGGVGGSAMTKAHTIVLYNVDVDSARVYFGGSKLAYEVECPNEVFFDDIANQSMASIDKVNRYKGYCSTIYYE